MVEKMPGEVAVARSCRIEDFILSVIERIKVWGGEWQAICLACLGYLAW